MIGTEQERAALMAAIDDFAATSVNAIVSDSARMSLNGKYAAIRAMLAPDDAVVRTEVAAVIATRIIHPNAVYMNGPFRSRSEQDRCEWAADEIIAVLRGEATRDENA